MEKRFGVVRRMRYAEVRVREVRDELFGMGAEVGDEQAMERMPERERFEFLEPRRGGLDVVGFDDALDREDDGDRPLVVGESRLRRFSIEAVDEVPGTELVDNTFPIHLPRGPGDVRVPVGDQNPQRIADFLEAAEEEDEIDHRLLVGQRIVREVAGPGVHRREPAHETSGTLALIEPLGA